MLGGNTSLFDQAFRDRRAIDCHVRSVLGRRPVVGRGCGQLFPRTALATATEQPALLTRENLCVNCLAPVACAAAGHVSGAIHGSSLHGASRAARHTARPKPARALSARRCRHCAGQDVDPDRWSSRRRFDIRLCRNYREFKRSIPFGPQLLLARSKGERDRSVRPRPRPASTNSTSIVNSRPPGGKAAGG